jgi:hypothetical protein
VKKKGAKWRKQRAKKAAGARWAKEKKPQQ